MREEKVYGIEGFLEWEALLGKGASRVRVLFKGGGMTAYGVTPAIYRTRNEVIQHLIEQSPYFRDGRIKEISRR